MDLKSRNQFILVPPSLLTFDSPWHVSLGRPNIGLKQQQIDAAQMVNPAPVGSPESHRLPLNFFSAIGVPAFGCSAKNNY
jgi:hypothetical protein